MSDEHTAAEGSREDHSSHEGADSDADQPEKPGLGEAVANARILLRRTNKAMPFLWIAAVLVSLSLILFFIGTRQSLAPSERYLWGSIFFPVEFFMRFHSTSWCALALAALAFPVGQTHITNETKQDSGISEKQRKRGIGRHVMTCIELSFAYNAAIFTLLFALVVPGLVSAFLLLPAFYLALLRGYSDRNAILKAPKHALSHWRLNSIVAVGLVGTCYGLPMAAVLIIGLCAPEGQLLAVELDGMLTAAVVAGVVAVLVVQYMLFAIAVGASVAMEIYERQIDETSE